MEQQKFLIGERSFFMRPVTLGQLEHLVGVVSGLTFPNTEDPMAVVMTLAERLPKALACVLIEENKTPGDMVRKLDEPNGLEELSSFFRGEIPFETAVEAVTCFFALNPISSMSAKLTLLAKTVGGTMGALKGNGSNSSTPLSPAETSASETPSGSA